MAPNKPSSVRFPLANIADFARDPRTGTLYVAVGTQVVAIEPGSLEPSRSVSFDSTPLALALSDDGSQLYVAVGAVVARVEPSTLVLQTQFPLGSDPENGAAVPVDLAVMPGDSKTVAVAIASSWTSEQYGVHYYHDGVEMHPSEHLEDWFSNVLDEPWTHITSVAFGDSGELYAYDGATTGFGLGRIRTSEDGVIVEQMRGEVVLGFDVELVYRDHKLFASSGQVVDPAQLTVLGTFPAVGSMAVSDSGERAYFFRTQYSAADGFRYFVDCFDSATYARSGVFEIVPGLSTSDSRTWGRLSLWGKVGLALHLDSALGDDYAVLLPDVLERVAGCSPDESEPIVRSPIEQPDAEVDEANYYVLDARWLTFDPSTGALYVSVGSWDSRYPNSVVRFPNNDTGAVDFSARVGSEPGPLAVSDDGTRVWSGLDGAAVVVGVDVRTAAVGTPIQIGYCRAGEVYAQDLEAIPGTNGSFAVAGKSIYSTARPGIHVFDGATLRYPWKESPQTLIAHIAGLAFEFVGPTTILSVSGGEQVLLALESSELRATKVSDSYARQVQIGGGFALDDRGTLVNVADLSPVAQLTYLGRMLSLNTKELRYFKISPSGRRIYDVGDYSGASAIECLDVATGSQTGVIPLSLDLTNTRELEFFGDKGLAVRQDGILVIVPKALSVAGCEP